MATRFYLSSTAIPKVSPAFAAGWTRTTEADRRVMSTTKDGSASDAKTAGGATDFAASTTFLNRMFVSLPMAAGIVFDTSVTMKSVIMCGESNADDNITIAAFALRVYSFNGATLQAALVTGIQNLGPANTEWPTSGLQNRQYADGDALTGTYTTVVGDRITYEVGAKVAVAGGTSVTGTQEFGSPSGSDLAENQTNTTQGTNPWFELSNAITFIPEPFGIFDQYHRRMREAG